MRARTHLRAGRLKPGACASRHMTVILDSDRQTDRPTHRQMRASGILGRAVSRYRHPEPQNPRWPLRIWVSGSGRIGRARKSSHKAPSFECARSSIVVIIAPRDDRLALASGRPALTSVSPCSAVITRSDDDYNPDPSGRLEKCYTRHHRLNVAPPNERGIGARGCAHNGAPPLPLYYTRVQILSRSVVGAFPQE
jgi:hypothetical protein